MYHSWGTGVAVWLPAVIQVKGGDGAKRECGAGDYQIRGIRGR